jgi:SAM-dependent methyltransferase
MRSQRPPRLPPALDAVAEQLPFDDGSFDAAMATVTVHQWRDWRQGVRELRRVSRGAVVMLTFDPATFGDWWLAHYVPELVDLTCSRLPAIDDLCDVLGGASDVTVIPTPADCADGFIECFHARPEMLLRSQIWQSQSGWALLPLGVERRAIRQLAHDLRSGSWDRRFGSFRTRPVLRGSLRLVVGRPSAPEWTTSR